MICVRATRPKKQEKVGLGPGAEMAHGGAPNFYYGAPAPYAESIAPSHHSTYAHYYDDEEDGWDMPNFYNEGYMKVRHLGFVSNNKSIFPLSRTVWLGR